MSPEPPLRLLFGTDEPVPASVALVAGSLQAHLRGTRLGPITFEGHEVWHGVDFLYRDADWGTPEPVVDRIEHVAEPAGFRVRLQGHIAGAARIHFDITITGGPASLRYEVTASAAADLATNRTGLVVMHPLAACGQPVEVRHTDGRSSASTFPLLVAPQPPFTLVRAIRHAYADAAWASVHFEGDDFELEDQRNNADASFKTYSRSNLMPRPYVLRAGARLRHCVELRVEGVPARPAPPANAPVRLRIGPVAGRLPAIGTSVTTQDLQRADAARQALRDLRPAVLHLVLERPGDLPDSAALASLLAAGDCALRLDILGVTPARADAELGEVAAALRRAGVAAGAVAVFPSTPPVLQAARAAFPQARVGGGTPYFFTQLNRVEDLGPLDFLAFSTASVVHGAGDEDIMAGLQSLPAMLRTLEHRHGTMPVHVGPSSIAARRSPLGAQPPSDGTRRLALARRDPRTRGLYGAAWTLGYVAQLARAGAQAITLHALHGESALVPPEGTTPAFEILRRMRAPAHCRSVDISAPHAMAALVLERDDAPSETLLANLLGREIAVELQERAWPDEVRVMDAAALTQRRHGSQAPCWRAVSPGPGPLRLAPYAVVAM